MKLIDLAMFWLIAATVSTSCFAAPVPHGSHGIEMTQNLTLTDDQLAIDNHFEADLNPQPFYNYEMEESDPSQGVEQDLDESFATSQDSGPNEKEEASSKEPVSPVPAPPEVTPEASTQSKAPSPPTPSPSTQPTTKPSSLASPTTSKPQFASSATTAFAWFTPFN